MAPDEDRLAITELVCKGLYIISIQHNVEEVGKKLKINVCWSIILPTQSELERLVALLTPIILIWHVCSCHLHKIERTIVTRTQNMLWEGTIKFKEHRQPPTVLFYFIFLPD